MSKLRRESPLVGQKQALHGAITNGKVGITLCQRPFLGHICIRGRGDDSRFVESCAQVLGVTLPQIANTQVKGEGFVICWMRPTEWLLITQPETCQQWLDKLKGALDGLHAGVVDLSGGQTLIQVSGKHALDTLAKGTTLDLHPWQFGTNQCARTLLAKTTAFIRVVEPGQAFEIVVRRSFADYLWQWLYDAADEYNCNVETPKSKLA